MKKMLQTVAIVVGCLVIAAGVVGGTVYLSSHYLDKNDSSKSSVTQCRTKGVHHVVILKNDASNPKHIDGKLCDALTITNKDKAVRFMAFGEHDEHKPYDGIVERKLAENQSMTFTFNKMGTYIFHDHIGDIVQGSFTVTD